MKSTVGSHFGGLTVCNKYNEDYELVDLGYEGEPDGARR
jgi:hypothetical protein